ncbi:hypothetical protein B5E41_12165 [Rhizobium esperanzae]|uniref:Uncharacterized protein n=1 Tax=Rhizobium esperanzae TaxID=1967781 RepID=A0A246DVY9_9HYPH|nr:hypothetical protein B5E41_12165 [Rhizobium esperanzae]
MAEWVTATAEEVDDRITIIEIQLGKIAPPSGRPNKFQRATLSAGPEGKGFSGSTHDFRRRPCTALPD